MIDTQSLLIGGILGWIFSKTSLYLVLKFRDSNLRQEWNRDIESAILKKLSLLLQQPQTQQPNMFEQQQETEKQNQEKQPSYVG